MSIDSITAALSSFSAIVLTIVFFGGSIFVHELGHFLAARWRGLVIERFSIGFGPKVFSWKRSGVEYCLSLIPLGGYVALPQLGQIEPLEGPVSSSIKVLKPVSFIDKCIVLVMGAVFNVLFALLLGAILWKIGLPTPAQEQTTVVGYVHKQLELSTGQKEAGPAYEAGIRPSDKILAIDGTEVSRFADIQKLIVTGTHRGVNGKPIAVFDILRDGKKLSLTVHPYLLEFNPASADKMRFVGFSPKSSIVIGDVQPLSPAQKAGLQSGDTLLSIDHIPLLSAATLSDFLHEHPDATAELVFMRAGKTLSVQITPQRVPYTQPLLALKEDLASGEAPAIELLPAWSATVHIPEDANHAPVTSFTVMRLNPAMEGLLELGDRVVAIQGSAVESISAAIATINARPMQEPLRLHVLRESQALDVILPAQLRAQVIPAQTEPMLGFSRQLQRILTHPTPFDQVRDSLDTTLRVLRSLLSPGSDVGLRSLMGPPGIVRILHRFSAEDIRLVLAFTVLLNINLAILNLLPIPVLDGGHIFFAFVERIRRRQLPVGFVTRVQGVFVFLLLAMMIYVSFFDVRRWQGDRQQEKAYEAQQNYYIEPRFSHPTP